MSRFAKNDDGTVTDSKTGLTWSNTLAGKVNYQGAEEFVKTLGEGWRLPNDEELLSIVDRARHDPAIDTEFFPNTKTDWYWTSKQCSWDSSSVWVVNFAGGYVNDLQRHHPAACVMAVRSDR